MQLAARFTEDYFRDANTALADIIISDTSPEKKLLCAILDRAISDYFMGVRHPHWRHIQEYRDILRTARHWLFSDTTKIWSYRWVCDNLSLDHLAIRRAMLECRHELATRWGERQRHRKKNRSQEPPPRVKISI